VRTYASGHPAALYSSSAPARLPHTGTVALAAFGWRPGPALLTCPGGPMAEAPRLNREMVRVRVPPGVRKAPDVAIRGTKACTERPLELPGKLVWLSPRRSRVQIPYGRPHTTPP
jgi:hypothetical protein